MTKQMLMLTAILSIASGLFAQHKPKFSVRIHPIRDTFAVTDTITLEVTTTNLTHRTLDPMKWAMPYTYLVRRDGVPAKKLEHPEWIGLPKGLPPHHSVTGDEYVQHYVGFERLYRFFAKLLVDHVPESLTALQVFLGHRRWSFSGWH